MKWLGWILKLVVTIVAVSLLTVATTGYIVNSYIQTLLSSYNLPITAQAPGIGGIMKGMLGFGGTGGGTDQAEGETDTDSSGSGTGKSDTGKSGTVDTGSGKTDPSGDGQSNNGSPKDPTTETNGSPTGGTNTDANGTEADAPEDALPVMGGMNAGDALGEDQQVVVTPDDLVAKKDELPDQQKEEIFAILMKKLPQEDMQKLTVALEGGLTEIEMINIEQILSKHLDKTEYSKVMELLKK
ncbi:hypothetical protein [Paenibacillus rubinfantis]|uniref:hypothetical protein n=1 Tax=Paenibacillus rubinfantis TaxID=1720296 RepID=UPI00073EA0CB|nr:hypothetical protein [Paenibacillus rubinfantis]